MSGAEASAEPRSPVLLARQPLREDPPEPHHTLVDALLRARDEQPRIAERLRQPPRDDALFGDARVHGAPQPARSLVEEASARGRVGHDHLGGLRRRGRARVGGEVDERDVDLVTDGADDRDAARRDVAHERLVVERQEIVLRAAATADDDDVHVRHALQHPEGAPYALGGAGALHLRRREEDARAAATKRDLADVVDHRALRARDDANDARIVRERPLLLGREEALGLQLLLQQLERLEERALPRRLDAIADELQLAAGRPVRRLAAHAHARAVLDQRATARRDLRPIEDDVDRGVLALVLQREVDVAARRRPRAAHLTLDPQLGSERALQRS